MITIIGAGISGLSLAWHLQKQGKAYRILEASSSAGGYIGSETINGYILEKGPNSLMVDEEVQTFLESLGLKENIIEASPAGKHRFIYKNGRHQALPSGPLSLLSNSYFSRKAKWSILTEAWKKTPAHQNPDETLSDFFQRRFNKEVVDYAVNPFVMGVYAGSPDQLLTELAFPTLHQYEREYGSVLKGLIKNAGKRRKVINFTKGLQQLTDTIAHQLTAIHLNTPVDRIERQTSGVWKIISRDQNFESDYIVITTPAREAARLLKAEAQELSNALQQVNYPPMAAVHSVYKRSQVGHPLNGFGALSPAVEKQFISGCIWTSSIFPYKSNADEVLLTSMVGGTRNPEVIRLRDEELKRKVHEDQSRY